MTIVETREHLGIKGEKPLHFGGEVDKKRYLKHLDTKDRLLLKHVMSHMHSVAVSIGENLHVLAVGSSADLQASHYNDIDLLVCLEGRERRLKFYHDFREALEKDSELEVSFRSPDGSAPLLNSPHIQQKLFVFAVASDGNKPRALDLTFLSEHGGTFEETLLLHRQNDLSFSIVQTC